VSTSEKRGQHGASGDGEDNTGPGGAGVGRTARDWADGTRQGNQTGDWHDVGGIEASQWQSGGAEAGPATGRTVRGWAVSPRGGDSTRLTAAAEGRC
jgi:hypothetical protein